jgi:hypothetical protein
MQVWKTERRYMLYVLFCKQWEEMKFLPLEELESALATLFQQACVSSTSIDCIDIRKEATDLGVDNFMVSDCWVNKFKRRTWNCLSDSSR